MARLKGGGALVPLVILASRVLGAVLGLVLSLVLARTMGPHEMGRALTALSLGMLLPILASGSAEIGASRFLTQALHRGDPATARGFLRMTWQVAAVCIPVLILGGLVLFALWTPAGADRGAMMLAVVGAALMGVVRIGSAHAMGFSRVILATLPGAFLRPALMLALLGGLLALGGGAPSPGAVMGCFAVSAAVIALIQQSALRRNYAPLAAVAPDLAGRRAWILYGLQLGATMLFIEYSKDITVLFAALSLTPPDVARLSVALSFIGFARFAVVAVNQSITPEMSRAIGAGARARLIAVVDRANLLKTTAALAGLVFFALAGQRLLAIYDDSFARVWWLLLLMMVDPLCLALFGPSANVLSLQGGQRGLMAIALVMVPLLAALVAAGGRLDGLAGAATGATLGWVAFYAILALRVWRETGLDLTVLGTARRRLG